MATLRAVDLPLAPGVYALYRDGEPVYVGKATSLQARVWSNHSSRGYSMGNSAMRRNVAEHLGYGAPNDIKSGTVRLAPAQVDAVREWLDGCEIAWIECANEPAAVDQERELKREFLPPLTKR